MESTNKIRVAVLYGGRSAEHEISLRSAANVIQHLDTSRFEVIPIGIDKSGNWLLGKPTFTHSLHQQQVLNLQHEETWFTPEWLSKPIQSMPAQALMSSTNKGALFDVIFPVVHGTFCEDGSLQGLLELAGLPYVGCGVLSSAVGMDKDVAKRLASLAGVPVVPYIVIKQNQWKNQTSKWIEQIETTLSFPVFVKPANTGSSIGISKVKEKNQLKVAIEEAFRFDTKILIEKALEVRELEIAVLESLTTSDFPIISDVGEVKSHHEFYSYEAKYLDENGASLFIPAAISSETKLDAQAIAKKIFMTLECEGMARIDLFLEQDSQQLYFNEINTIPGFTQISMYPKLMEHAGMHYSALLSHLIDLAISKHQHKNQLIRSWR